jgi:hypothetical protein
MSYCTLPFRNLLVLLVLFAVEVNSVYCQKKDFTLQDAVVKQYSKFYPDRLWLLEWIPETESYSYLKRDGAEQTLVVQDVTSGETKNLFTTEQLSSMLGRETPLRVFPMIS